MYGIYTDDIFPTLYVTYLSLIHIYYMKRGILVESVLRASLPAVTGSQQLGLERDYRHHTLVTQILIVKVSS